MLPDLEAIAVQIPSHRRLRTVHHLCLIEECLDIFLTLLQSSCNGFLGSDACCFSWPEPVQLPRRLRNDLGSGGPCQSFNRHAAGTARIDAPLSEAFNECHSISKLILWVDVDVGGNHSAQIFPESDVDGRAKVDSADTHA